MRDARVEIAGVDGHRDEREEHERGRAHQPGPARKDVEREEDDRERDERDREVRLHERTARPSLEPVSGDVVELPGIEDRVDDEYCDEVESEQRPDEKGLTLARRSPPRGRRGRQGYARSASERTPATYAWSSSSSRAWNGSASVRALASSATGHMPSRKPKRSRMYDWRWMHGR